MFAQSKFASQLYVLTNANGVLTLYQLILYWELISWKVDSVGIDIVGGTPCEYKVSMHVVATTLTYMNMLYSNV